MKSQLLSRLRVFLIAFVNGTLFAFTTPVVAQGVDPDTGERLFEGLTEAEIEAMIPTSANPFISYLPAGVEPDYRYWRARTALDSYKRSERRGELSPPAQRTTVHESESPNSSGDNDTFARAQPVPLFGTGQDDLYPAVTPMGNLAGSGFSTETVGSFAEDDGAIPLATPTLLQPGEGLVITGATIGDGPHGATTGDFDFYAVTASAESQTIHVDIATYSSGLDSWVAIYDAEGTVVASNNDRFNETDSFLEFRTPAPGTYYVAVFGIEDNVPFLSDPFNSGSGPGIGSTGTYTLRLGLSLRDVDVFSFELEAGDVLGVGEATGALVGSRVEILGPDGTVRMGSRYDVSGGYPQASPLPSGGSALKSANTVAHVAGTYAIAVSGFSPGSYALGAYVFRPRTEREAGATQVLFADFDGATINAQQLFGQGNPVANLSPFSDFIPGWNLELEDGDALIDGIMVLLERKQSRLDGATCSRV